MIARMTGTLLELDSQTNAVLLEVGDIAYEVMVPGYTVSDLSAKINRAITLYCLEYLEGSAGGSTFIPRIVGFPQVQDKTFFQRFISVKGIGIRKALRALAKPLADIAYSIESGDTKMLTTLPEVGKRTAEQIVAELKGKMADFAMEASHTPSKARKPKSNIEREALDILIQLGEQAAKAEELIDRVTKIAPDITTTDALVQAVYRAKAGAI
ncbi:MAG: hypothetical protein K9M57_10105 [Phycisphaerae bacterium]|nr:hypothetical protein [Phycisphaerae bacterium]